MARTPWCAAVVVFASLALAGFASAAELGPDSHAPRGAPADWLPAQRWVMERWMPFDEARLEALLQLNYISIWRYIERPNHSLYALARLHHLPTVGLAQRLVAHKPKGGSPTSLSTLLARTRDVLSQPHLGQHMFGHIFHTWSVLRSSKYILGVTSAQFDYLYFRRDRSIREIAATAGHGVQEVYGRAMVAERRAGAVGIAQGATSMREEQVLLSRDQRYFRDWFNYRPPLVRAVSAEPDLAGVLSEVGLVCHLR